MFNEVFSMKNKFFFCLSLLTLATTGSFLQASPLAPYNKPSEKVQIFAHNRPLFKIHGKTLSLLDVQKFMDLTLFERAKDVYENPVQRYHYYMQNWKWALQEMIYAELMLMEAEELKIELTNGEVHAEVDSRFGKDIYKVLDILGISYNALVKKVNDDLLIQQVSGARFGFRAYQRVTPDSVQDAYRDYLVQNPPKDAWTYRTVTVSNLEDPNLSEEFAENVFHFLKEKNTPVEILQAKDPSLNIFEDLPGLSYSVSDEITLTTKEIRKDYLEALEELSHKEFSAPICQKSRSGQSDSYKILYLANYVPGDIPSFEEMSNKLYNQAINKNVDEERTNYFQELKKRFCFEEIDVEVLFPGQEKVFTIRE